MHRDDRDIAPIDDDIRHHAKIIFNHQMARVDFETVPIAEVHDFFLYMAEKAFGAARAFKTFSDNPHCIDDEPCRLENGKYFL